MKLLKRQLLLSVFMAAFIIIMTWINMQHQFKTVVYKEKASIAPNAKERWRRCLNFIQQKIIRSLSDVFEKRLLLQNPVLLVDPAYHRNFGDTMLTYGEMILMERRSITFTECGILQSRGRNAPCINFSNFSNRIAMWQAGGNWGTLWRSAQTVRMSSFPQLLKKNMTILGMPQSLYYHNGAVKMNDSHLLAQIIEQTIGTTKSKEHIILSWRQQNNYEEALQLYPQVDNRLFPDVAFMIGPIENTQKWTNSSVTYVDLLFLLRTDHESRIKSNQKDTMILLKEYTEEHNLTFRVVDWYDWEKFYSANNFGPPIEHLQYKAVIDFNNVFASQVAMFASAKIVITDRLHASIFAFLSYKPHIFIDQSTQKINRTRETAFGGSEDCRDEHSFMNSQSHDLKDAVNKASAFLVKFGL